MNPRATQENALVMRSSVLNGPCTLVSFMTSYFSNDFKRQPSARQAPGKFIGTYQEDGGRVAGAVLSKGLPDAAPGQPQAPPEQAEPNRGSGHAHSMASARVWQNVR